MNDAKEFFAEGGATHALTDIQFSIYDIELACSELKASSAAGADGISASLLKTCRKKNRGSEKAQDRLIWIFRKFEKSTYLALR